MTTLSTKALLLILLVLLLLRQLLLLQFPTRTLPARPGLQLASARRTAHTCSARVLPAALNSNLAAASAGSALRPAQSALLWTLLLMRPTRLWRLLVTRPALLKQLLLTRQALLQMLLLMRLALLRMLLLTRLALLKQLLPRAPRTHPLRK